MPFVPDTQSGFVPDAPGFVPDEVSPYSAEGIVASRQALVQSEARLRQLREEEDAAALVPKVFVGVRKPFSDEIAAQFQVPESIAAFGAEAVKSSPSIASGAAAASAATPLANRLGAIPGPIGAAARFGIPLVAGGAAAIGTRLAQDEVLPQILPEGAQQLYKNTNELAARNPTAALLGQFAGSAPFFRPGLPVNSVGGARVAVPAITGVVGGGIEGANQIAAGEFDPTRLAAATLGSALMNRETALGQRIAPNLVLPNISARGVPDELGAITAARRDIPLPTDIVPDEFAAVQQARNQVIAERAPAQIDPAVQAAASDAKAQALAERMIGKDAPDQLAILEQELQLQKGTLTPAEQRAGLEMKQLLKQQIEQQQALEKAAADQQKAARDAAKAQADAQKAATDAAAAAAEPPKSAQILAEPAAPPAIANVATEIGTQTSPYAVQGKINELTAAPAQILGQESVAMQAVAGGAAQGTTGPAQAVVNAPTQISRRAPIRAGETIEAAIERLAANGETALAIAARVNSSVEVVREIAKKNGIAIAMKSRVKPDIVMTPAPQQITLPVAPKQIAPTEPVQVQAGEPFAGPRVPTPEQAKKAQTKSAVKNAADYQFTVFRPGQGIPDAIQVDAIGAKGEPLGSSNVADLNKAGAKLPDVPDWVPQGRYTLEQMNALIKQGYESPFAKSVINSIAGGAEYIPKNIQDAIDAMPSELRDSIYSVVNDANSIAQSRELLDADLLKEIESARKPVPKEYKKAIEWLNNFNPKQGEPTNAITERKQPEGNQPEYPGTAQGADLLPYGGEVRQGASEPTSGGNRNVESENVAPGDQVRQGAVSEPLSLDKVNESRLLALAQQLGIDPRGMSGDRLRARIESNAQPEAISEALAATVVPDIIDRLQAKKWLPKRPRGEVAAAGPDLIYDAAHDAALDVAILGIRAGRALNEIVQLAVAKLRALNPKATDDDVARLTKDITEAHAGRTTPVTEAEQLMAEAGSLAPVAGRAAEDTQAASRMRQTRGAVSSQALTPLASAGAGGLLGYTETDKRPGETDEEFRARRLKNTAIGIGLGGAAGAGVNALAIKAAKAATQRGSTARGKVVELPQISEGEGIRWNAEKAIINKAYPEPMRQALASDPEIIYDKISRTRLGEMTVGATDAELTAMLASPDNNERVAALIEQANRAAVTPGMEAEAARLRREVSKQFTVPAQLLGLGNLVRDPGAMVEAVEATLNASYAGGERTKKMTQAVRDNLFERARRNIQAEQRYAKARRAATENFNDATMAEFMSARKELGDSAKALADYSKDILPEGWGEMVSKAIKGNLLAPLSFAKNMFGNAAWQSMLRGAESIASGLDMAYSAALGRPRKLMLGNPFPSAGEAKAFYDGVKLASKELLTGPSAESYVKTEVQRGFHPMRAMVQVFSGVPAAERVMERRGIASLPVNTETGRVSVNDRLKKLFEATLGITPEASFRMLNLGDKPVRLTSEARLLNEQANLQGLTGTAKQKAIALPSEATQALVDREGLSGIMAQKNMLAQRVGGLFDNWIVDITEGLGLGRPEAIKVLNKIVGSIQLPFRAFPANFAVNALNFAAPPIAMAKAAVQARNGNRREALRNIGEAVIGSMIYGAAAWLYENKLITPPLDMRDKKRRSAQYEMGASRINIDGIKRLQNGEDPSYRKGDETRDWSTLGPAAAPLYVYTARRAKEENKAARTGDQPEVPAMTGAMMDLSGAASFTFDQSFLSGTSAFIEAIKDWDNMGDRYIENIFRAITAIPLPATLEAVSKMNQQFVPDMKGDSELETLGNIWDFKTMQLPQDDRSNLKRDFWGEPIRRVPEGNNPYVHAFIDVTKSERQAKDPLKESLLEVYKQTNSTDVYPGLVTSQFSVSNNGTTTVDLNRGDYDDLQQFVGAYRRRFAEQVTAMPEFSDPATLPEAKILALQEAYREGAKLGKALLLDKPGMRERYPELFGLPSGKESRVISRDPVARGRLRMGLTPTP